MYLEHHDTDRLQRAEQASAFLCEVFPHELGPNLSAGLDSFHDQISDALKQRAKDKAHRQGCPAG